MIIGDKVKVINPGASYTTYSGIAKYMKLTRWKYYRGLPSSDKIYQIVNMALHGSDIYSENILSKNNKTLVCGIEDINNGEQYLVNIKGLEVYIMGLFTIEDFEI